MSASPYPVRDPITWHFAAALTFLFLCLVRINVPSAPYFDEVHYLPAARAVLGLAPPLNIEHPPLGKQLLALGMAIFGDQPFGWRIMPVLFGTLALYSAMRAMWFASLSRGSSLLTGFYLITGFALLVQSRIAMLDIFMVSFLMLALWMCAAAMREAETARWRLAIAGAALGCAMASKWNAIPLAVLPGITFFAVRLRSAGWRFAYSRRGAPIGGVSLVEAILWLGIMPLALYALTFWPFVFAEHGAISPGDLVDLQAQMLDMQKQVLKPHPYQSTWGEWITDWRAIWYLYEVSDGAQRGILLVGNPLTMLAGLPALLWCAWAGLFKARRDALAVAILYAVSLGMWIIAPKPVQFYYHYFLPSCFLLAALALATQELWVRGKRAVPYTLWAMSAGLLAFYFPILTAAPLADDQAFLRWSWLKSWR